MTTHRINFTKKTIESLPNAVKGKRDHYQDSRVKALRLEVTDKGKKTYKVYRKKGGRPIRYTIGDVADWSIENARTKAEEVNALISKGINPNIEKRKMREEMTFGGLFDMYLERYAKKHKRTWEQDRWEVQKHLSHWLNRKVSSIDKNEVQRLHTKLGKNSGLYQANRILARISSIYNKAIEWGWDGTNPAQGIKKFKEKSRDRFLRLGELPFFFEALQEEAYTTACDYILMSLYTGARKSNVLSMRWTEIDFDRAVWRIPETKNGESLTIALSAEALEILKRRQKETNRKWVFPSDRTDGHLSDPKKAWKRILVNATIKFWYTHTQLAPLVDQAMQRSKTHTNNHQLYTAIQNLAKEKDVELPIGLMDIRLHDLRRTLGSFQAAAGANQYIIGKSLGHKSQQATAIYARLDLDPVRESVQVASTAIRNAGNKKGKK